MDGAAQLWWSLPGPARFVERVVEDFRAGRHVVLLLPHHMPGGLSSALRRAIESEGLREWQSLPIGDLAGASPADVLFDRFLQESDPAVVRTAAALATEADFSWGGIWLDEIDQRVWRAWKALLIEYARACRASDRSGRTLFCVPLLGALALDPPLGDEQVVYHRWSASVDDLDLQLFAAALMRERPSGPHKQLAVAVAAKLAGWDPGLVEWLADEPVERICDPIALLRDFGAERVWNARDARPLAVRSVAECALAWADGLTDRHDGRGELHSGALAFNPSGERAIRRRIWSAQVGVLFPLIEERRQEIILTLARLHPPDWDEAMAYDLEIGPLLYRYGEYLRERVPQAAALAQQLRQMRNYLAHLRPLPASLLQCKELFAPD